MKTTPTAPNYRGYRFPPEIISHCVWFYFRFSLSFRDIEEIMAERGVIVTYETVRQWCLKFGQEYANALKKRRGKLGDKWHGSVNFFFFPDECSALRDIFSALSYRFFTELPEKTSLFPIFQGKNTCPLHKCDNTGKRSMNS